MTDLVLTNNGSSARKFLSAFRSRDIFVHDGSSLRRISLTAPVQFTFAVVAILLLLWSIFSAVQLATAVSDEAGVEAARAEMMRMEREVEAMQADVLAIKQVAEHRFQLTQAEVRKLGIDPKRLAAPQYNGTGGPFEAVEPLKTADPNFKQLFTSWKKLDQIEQGAIAIPSAEPVKGSAFTSGYGVRSDPFRGRAAMHAGIDLAGPLGTPVYATADAVVGRSEWANGYGNLIELNHGRGIQTRYGHLSKSLVKPGQRVKRGEQIALMGSTGRSTGSHLHYEVRIDGKAVNPVPFLKSNTYLASIQKRAAALDPAKVAVGGPAEGKK